MKKFFKEPAMTITPEELGRAVRDARVKHAWTQVEFAERVGTSREWVSRLECGRGAQTCAAVQSRCAHWQIA
ncbi:MAG: helix-turn-helix domain-containing protein [Methanothrix sp.]|nr:helix-turn-helix domain-containing protein [Methanothrix sp.]